MEIKIAKYHKMWEKGNVMNGQVTIPVYVILTGELSPYDGDQT